MAFRFGFRTARRVLAAVALASVATLAACGDSGDSDSDTYALFSIDGDQVPVVYDDGFGFVTTISSGSLSLSGGNKWSFSIRGKYEEDGLPDENWTEGARGTYTVSGDTYTFTATHYTADGVTEPADPGDVSTATKTGDTITLSQDGSVVVFKK